MNQEISVEELSERIAARRADPRTAAVVRRAFLPPFGALTLRRYLALEEEGSPLLSGEWPWESAAAMAHAFCTAYAVLWPDRQVPGPEVLEQGLLEMVGEVKRAFAAMMPMRFPRSPGESGSSAPDGLGWVPHLVARALTSGIDGALDMPMDQLFILVAAMAANEGAECAGEDYRDREAAEDISSQKSEVGEDSDLVPVAGEAEQDRPEDERSDQGSPYPV